MYQLSRYAVIAALVFISAGAYADQVSKVVLSPEGQVVSVELLCNGRRVTLAANGQLGGGEDDEVDLGGGLRTEKIGSQYQNGGKISRIGDLEIDYIGTQYQNGGKISKVGKVQFDWIGTQYQNGGKISKVGEVRINYDRGVVSGSEGNDDFKLTVRRR